MKNSEHNANSWAYHTSFAQSHDYWINGEIYQEQHTNKVRWHVDHSPYQKGRIGKFSNWLRCRSLVGISRVAHRVLICSMSFSLRIAITLLSLLCLRRILPLLVQMYFQLNFFLSSLSKENKCLFLFVRFSLMKTRSELGFLGALLFNFLLSL